MCFPYPAVAHAHATKRWVGIKELPEEIWEHIIGLLDFTSLCSACGVCKGWNQMASPCKVPRLFKHLHKTIEHRYESVIYRSPHDIPEVAPPLLFFATLPKSSDDAPHALVHFPYYNHTLHWPLPAPLLTIHSSKGFFCGIVSPTKPGQGFRFVVTSHSISSSTSWTWEHLPPTEHLKHTDADHLPYRVRFVAGCSNGGGYFIVVVPEEQAREIEVYSSERGAWTRHCRGETTTYVHGGFEGHIPIGVVGEGSVALSFNPVSNAWGCRAPFPRTPFFRIFPGPGKHIYEYVGYGEKMLVTTLAVRVLDGCQRGALAIVAEEHEEGGGIKNTDMFYKWHVPSSGLMNVSSCGGTVCYQWFNWNEDRDRCICHFNRHSAGSTRLNTWDKAFLVTCCD